MICLLKAAERTAHNALNMLFSINECACRCRRRLQLGHATTIDSERKSIDSATPLSEEVEIWACRTLEWMLRGGTTLAVILGQMSFRDVDSANGKCTSIHTSSQRRKMLPALLPALGCPYQNCSWSVLRCTGALILNSLIPTRRPLASVENHKQPFFMFGPRTLYSLCTSSLKLSR